MLDNKYFINYLIHTTVLSGGYIINLISQVRNLMDKEIE